MYRAGGPASHELLDRPGETLHPLGSLPLERSAGRCQLPSAVTHARSDSCPLVGFTQPIRAHQEGNGPGFFVQAIDL